MSKETIIALRTYEKVFAVLVALGSSLMLMPHTAAAQDVQWAIAATITKAGETVDRLYFRGGDVSFDSEGACKAFVESGDDELTAANDGLRAAVAHALGPDGKVEVSCVQAPSE